MHTRELVGLLMLVGSLLIPQVSSSDCANCCYCANDGQSWFCADGGGQGWRVCLGGGASPCTYFDACGYAGGGCFAAGTMVMTEAGYTPIESLEVGERVLAMSEDGLKKQRVSVTETYRSIEMGYYVINGTIKVTGTHPFRVGGEWVQTRNLRVGAELVGENGEPVAIASLEQVERGVRVYNIEVSGNHTFFAGGVLVHNKKNPNDP